MFCFYELVAIIWLVAIIAIIWSNLIQEYRLNFPFLPVILQYYIVILHIILNSLGILVNIPSSFFHIK